MLLKEGTLLQGGKYKIVRHIASGGFGNTYEALDTSMGNARVAIKEFFVKDCCGRDSVTQNVTLAVESKRNLVAKLKVMFLAEAEDIRNMKHDNIVRVYSSFEENDTAYYVMEYIDGKSLQDIINERGALPEKEAIMYVQQIADALKYMHSFNFIHLGIYPENIKLQNEVNIKICFDTIKLEKLIYEYDESPHLPWLSTGGSYIAPEAQPCIGNPSTMIGPSADIYSLGAILYSLLTCTPPPSPFSIISGETVPPSLPSNISIYAHMAVKMAMIPQKKTRTQTVDEFLYFMKNDNLEVMRSHNKELENSVFYKSIIKDVMNEVYQSYAEQEIKKEEQWLNAQVYLSQGGWFRVLRNKFKYYDNYCRIKKAKTLIEKKNPKAAADIYIQMGACYQIWYLQKQILKNKYNVDWYSPDELNPGTHYD